MKTVMVFGTFDIVHPGHLWLLKEAKKYGDYLMVVIARDITVKKIKGKKPWYTERERKHFLEAIRCVDTVVLGSAKDKYQRIADYRPDVIVLGHDQTVFTDDLKEKISALRLKTKIIRLKEYKKARYKTSHIKKHLLPHI